MTGAASSLESAARNGVRYFSSATMLRATAVRKAW
jgi:hypothetical protein